MNKIMKKILIIALILCLVGSLGTVAGVMAGGLDYVQNTNLDEINGEVVHKVKKNEFSKRIKIDEVSEAEFDLIASDLIIKPSPDDECYLIYENSQSSDQKLKFANSDGKLAVSEEKKHKLIAIEPLKPLFNFAKKHDVRNTQKSTITLYLPKDDDICHLKSLVVDSAAGDVRLSDLSLKDWSLSVVTGDIHAINVNAENTDIESTTGDIILEYVSVSNGSIMSTTGDIDIAESLLKNISIDTSTGDVEITNSNYEVGSIKTLSGDFDTENLIMRDVKTYSSIDD